MRRCLVAAWLAGAAVMPAAPVRAGPDPAAPQPAASPVPHPLPVLRFLSVNAGTARVLHPPGAVAGGSVADPRVARVQAAANDTLTLFGLAPGRTSVLARDAAGAVVARYDVFVLPARPAPRGPDLADATPPPPPAPARSRARARRTAEARQTAEAREGGLIVTGFAKAPPPDAHPAPPPAALPPASVAAVDARASVRLRVRVAAMPRRLTAALGIDWHAVAALGPGAMEGVAATDPAEGGAPPGVLDVNRVIDALAEDRLVRVLARPDLTAASGGSASFMVGGARQDAAYAAALALAPTVTADGRILLDLRPAIGTGAPARHADTTVELGSGQSVAIASIADTPDGPGGALVIVVTPVIDGVSAEEPRALPPLPPRRILRAAGAPPVPADAGFLVE